MNVPSLYWMEVEGILLCGKIGELGGKIAVSPDLQCFQWIPPSGSEMKLLGKDECFNYYQLEIENKTVVLEQGIRSLRVCEFLN
ncbi:hypothetical protein HZB06_00545 [Candidatus Wolfebacteria bacterium]|nr:hypothetical protein [Candidatus Wolfebacteria bacterium]